ncbi:glycosyltransferase family 2 protein [Clostridium sp. C105KSO13]|uniref:glycosyltransferase family 2 protein n=1 Tax=Clostridium sp. C105KSO13 TaxID=1776045 RepID=UPI00074063FF|nr:glycosyltransferase family 2 protein [Clostridium sp. C105KSO13]CUX33769.1 Poly-beta-1,6-N-acetyl-D-glucosamine synthase [Clostridium sp. C105KSO13]
MDVTIIIPNYNGKHFMKPCLDSLENQTFSDFKILVIDNGSTDDSLSYMEENYPQIEVIDLGENYGFSRAVNEGIRLARTPYVILLNNDTTVDSHYVEEMIKAISRSPRIFSVSSKMIQMYHPAFIDSAGDLYTVIGWGICRGSGRSVANYIKSSPIFTACAGAAIYRRSVFKKIGYFDESHFAYLEDIDVGYRAKIYGYQNIYCPTALVYHVGSGTSGSKYNSFKVKLSARNSVYLNYKNMPILQLILNFIPLTAGYCIKYLFFCRKGFSKDYRDGLAEGFKTLKKQKKVPFNLRHLPNYCHIEIELIVNTFSYAKDWFTRKLMQK